jgi:hypothetical protein
MVSNNVGDGQRGGVGVDAYLDFDEFVFWTRYAQLRTNIRNGREHF